MVCIFVVSVSEVCSLWSAFLWSVFLRSAVCGLHFGRPSNSHDLFVTQDSRTHLTVSRLNL